MDKEMHRKDEGEDLESHAPFWFGIRRGSCWVSSKKGKVSWLLLSLSNLAGFQTPMSNFGIFVSK